MPLQFAGRQSPETSRYARGLPTSSREKLAGNKACQILAIGIYMTPDIEHQNNSYNKKIFTIEIVAKKNKKLPNKIILKKILDENLDAHIGFSIK